ncbi:hypothetical protein, partial [Aeromonas hydrophila]|uniref:hypothetical protein n=1 Tax=Aeromonas hydrophila TaxID=644 RepID=UPI001C5BE6A3
PPPLSLQHHAAESPYGDWSSDAWSSDLLERGEWVVIVGDRTSVMTALACLRSEERRVRKECAQSRVVLWGEEG